MPVHSKRLSDSVARAIPVPPAGYEIHWCPETEGFGLRVTAAGARAWIAERRVDGRTVRRTLGKAAGSAAISGKVARELKIDVSSELQQGRDRLAVKRAQRETDKLDALTFGDALRAYVKGKHRAKDGLPLKQRTVDDYLAMLAPARKMVNGNRTQSGELHSISERSVHKLTAEAIRKLHCELEPRGERRQTYAMQVLRAVLRHHGIAIEGNPLDPKTPGAARVHLAPSRGDPSPIPQERLGAWWRSACALQSVSADQLRFMLLTGCRPGEAAGLTVGDVDLVGKRATLRDTKNRKDHQLVLAAQAAAIVYWHAQGKKKSAKVFGIVDPGKTMATINEAAGTPEASPHKLRHTFATIADDLVTAATSRAMLNHASGDVTQQHYIGISESKLRAGWQAVADHIEAAP